MMILVDAMGGDNAPKAIVEGCIQALRIRKDIDITVIGDRRQIEDCLRNAEYDEKRLKVRHASEVITNNDTPSKAISKKKDSSMVVGLNMLSDGEGDAFISTGSSGALLIGSVSIVKRIKGVDRPAMGSVIPSKKGPALLLDSGLNLECKANYYLQFAQMGAAYMRCAFDIENPRIGLVNVGTEDEKGTSELREANELLRESDLNFVGNIEGRDVFEGMVDVIATDGFTGNVILKLIEGASNFFFGKIKAIFLKNFVSKLGAAFLQTGIKEFKKTLDPDVNGGAPILGVDGLVIKSHGNSTARTIRYVVLKAATLVDSGFVNDLKLQLGKK